jgi:hypothetical protein
MMLDADIVAVSPATVYRVLNCAGSMRRWAGKPSRKGQGFSQPAGPHEHWHVDVSYVNICGTFYYLCSVLDGYSRYIVHWEIRESMKECDVEIIIQRALERFPGVKPRAITDNGPQFTARDFKEFIRISGMTHVRTAPYYPQSNGKLERYHGTIKSECIRPKTPLCVEDARRVVGGYVQHYNDVRLHSAIGYVTPRDKLQGREKQVFALRDRRLEQARERRRRKRSDRQPAPETISGPDTAIWRINGQRESNFSFDHNITTAQDRRGCQVEAGISAPCGPKRSEVMPEVHFTAPTGRATAPRPRRDRNETVPTHLQAEAR